MRLDRRRVEKLEAKRREVKPVPDELLEAYYIALENSAAELEGRTPPHDIPEKPPDPVLEEYLRSLEAQAQERDRAIQQAEWRRRQHG